MNPFDHPFTIARLARACRSRRIDTFIKPFAGVRNTIGAFDSYGCFRRVRAAVLALAMVVLAGCEVLLEPGEGFDPIAPPAELELWHEQVTRAVTMWHVALGDDCHPFKVTPGEGMPVELVPLEEWPELEGYPNAIGWYDFTGLILVRADQSSRSRHFTLVHEMGHAVGLEHSNDPASVMYGGGASGNISPEDVRQVRAAVGCP